MIRVMLCDDHRIVREGLRQILGDADDISVAAEAADGPEAVRLLRDQPGAIDVLLLDIAMPGRDGLDVLRQLKSEMPRLPVLMLSTYPERQYAVRSIRQGAAGSLNKSADTAELVAAIRKAASGGVYITAQIAESLATAISELAGRLAHDTLSNREYQVFRMIAAGHTVGQIAVTLALSPNTVSTYRARVLEKTGVRNDVELALYAVRQNLLEV